MKRFKGIAIGGIQSKVFNLILFTVLVLMVTFMGVAVYQNRMLTQLANESSLQQQASIETITGQVMDSVVEQSLTRSNQVDTALVNGMFEGEANRVMFLADCAAELFAHPEDYIPRAYSGPDAKDDGTWTAKVIYADDVDPNDPVIKEKLGLISNLSGIMTSICPAYGAVSVYIGMPEGVHLTVSNTSSSWLSDDGVHSYDPRERGWYKAAVAEGDLVFYDSENDFDTGAYCIECAKPVYGPDGSLEAVVGTDLFLDDMQRMLMEFSLGGEHFLLVNQNGHAVPGPQTEDFPIAPEHRREDLQAGDTPLAQAIANALQGKESTVALDELTDGRYYIIASAVPSAGWALVSAFSEEVAMQPISILKDSNAEIQRESIAIYQDKTQKTRNSTMALVAIVVVLILGVSVVVGKRIVNPVNTITKRISELREGNLEFKMEDVYRTGDEVEELAESFAALSHKTVEYMETVQRVTAEKERIGAELSLATQIQASMLPHIFPAFPERKEFDIFASMDPAKEVGGDFYDYFLIDDDHLGIVIADVSGKGVPAALFMMASKIILQSVAMLGKSPEEILARTNDAVCSNNEAQMFVTVWMGILELSTGKLVASNAGHEYPVLKHAGENFELYKDRHGFVLGGMEGVRYRLYEIHMEPGSKLFVYTDGVPEATNAEQELFGTDRMVDALNSDPDADPENVLKNVRKAVDDFVMDAEQFDDLTMLCVEYKGNIANGEASAV